jgi:hypothetical protein
MFTTSIPTWVSLSFTLLFPIAIFMIAYTAKNAAIRANLPAKQASNIFRVIVGFYGIFLLYCSLMSFTGIFRVNALPPRILLCTTVPLILFYVFVVSRTQIFKTLLWHVTLQSLIRIHIFRLIGAYFLITYMYGALPKSFAFIGGIGDIFAAVTAIFVANAIEKGRPYSRKLAFAWNIVGIVDIVNVIVAAFVTTRLSLLDGSPGLIEFGSFPFCWIPAFAPATILFLHVTIFRKLAMKPTLTEAIERRGATFG